MTEPEAERNRLVVAGTPAVAAPFGLLAELTYRCPLHCPYCSNPVNLAASAAELSTAQWLDVISQAAELGVLQLHLSGGEPLARRDLAELVSHARGLGLYTNLVTSALGLTRPMVATLKAAGLDHVQISIQDAEAGGADAIAGTRAHAHKLAAAAIVKELGLPLTINAVLHRANLDHLAAIIDLAERLQADRLELANTQYYGWGLVNRVALLPTREQLAAAEPIARAARERLAGRMEIAYIVADYYSETPKPCMNGWASQQLTVTPSGDVLPCPVAATITDLPVESVLRRPLAEIWYVSEAFNRFRGTDWMRDPCRSCPRREIDFGGCRCQAFQLTGDASATDPVCHLSPDHGLIEDALAATAASAAASGANAATTADAATGGAASRVNGAPGAGPAPGFVMRRMERRR